jgi:hypothetical protein
VPLYPAKVTSRPLWTPDFISPTAWYDASDDDTITLEGTSELRGQLGIIDVTGTNPFTGVAWQEGDPYRIIFVTQGIYSAESSDLTTYDDIVQAEAEAAGLGAVTWKAIVSKTGEDARDRIGARIGVDYDGPIYRTDGVLMAEKLSRIWSGTVGQLNAKPQYMANATQQKQSDLTSVFGNWTGVWSGTNTDGTAENGMGSSSVNFGILAAEQRYWLDRGASGNEDAKLCLYAMSPVLYVKSAARVDQLDDKVGTNHLVQGTPANCPTRGRRPVNGLGCLDFDGDDNDMDFTSTINMRGKMAWLVIVSDKYGQIQVENDGNATQTRLQDVAGDDGIDIDMQGSAQIGNYSTAPRTSQAMSQYYAFAPHIMAWDYSDPIRFFRDGRVEKEEDEVATNAINTLRFGSYQGSSAFFDGALCEYVITPVLSLDDRLKMEGYLAHKWGGTSRLPSTHPYKTNPPRAGLPASAGSWTPDQADLLTWLEFA